VIQATEVLKTKKSLFGREKQVENKQSPLVQMWTEPGQLQSLGKASAIDIFMGNGDRLLALVNFENWKVDVEKRAIQLIDNVNNTSRDFFAPPSSKGTAKNGFADWMAQQWVKDFVDTKLDNIAELVMTNLTDTLNPHGLSPEFEKQSEEQVQHIRDAFEAHRPEMIQWYMQGLQQGKSLLLTALTTPERIVEGVPGSKYRTALTAVYARRYALLGLGANSWAVAEAQVAKVLDPNQGKDSRSGLTIGNNRNQMLA
jgi:hypothetical protein